MKGVVCEEAGRLVYREDLPEPVRGEGEAIVAIRRIGICGTDLHAYQGNQPYFTYPRILGHELSGVIEEIGDNPEGLRVGDQVSMIPYLHCGHCGACLSGKTNCRGACWACTWMAACASGFLFPSPIYSGWKGCHWIRRLYSSLWRSARMPSADRVYIPACVHS